MPAAADVPDALCRGVPGVAARASLLRWVASSEPPRARSSVGALCALSAAAVLAAADAEVLPVIALGAAWLPTLGTDAPQP